MMKRLLLAALVASALGGAALAGNHQLHPVVIQDDTAWGNLGDARSSANGSEYIGCHVFGSAASNPLAICEARDERGASLFCSTSEPAMVTAATAFGPTAFVTFGVNKDGQCRHVWSINLSYYAPAVP